MTFLFRSIQSNPKPKRITVYTTDKISVLLRKLPQGVHILHSLLYELGYDYAEMIIPDSQIPNRFRELLADSPRIVAHGLNNEFKVVYVPLLEMDKLTEEAIYKNLQNYYPYLLCFFSDAICQEWECACFPTKKDLNSTYIFSVDISSISEKSIQKMLGLRIDEDTSDHPSSIQELLSETCKESFSSDNTHLELRDRSSWQDCQTWWTAKFKEYPLLNAESESQLVILVKKGDLNAKNLLIMSNLRLVFKIAKYYANPMSPLGDMLQEGHLGLIRAAEKFDPSRGFRFSTYATWWIRRGISRAVAEKSRLIRLPVYLEEELQKILKISISLEECLCRAPTRFEIASKLCISEKKLDRILQGDLDPISLNTSVGDVDNCHLSDIIPASDSTNPLKIAMDGAFLDQIEAALNDLSDRQKTVMILRFGLDGDHPRTLEEIGCELSISRERVRQIESTTLHKLRKNSKCHRLKDFLAQY